MSTKYECDRCKIQTDNRDAIGSVTYEVLDFRMNLTSEHDLVRKELCSGCMKLVHDLMKYDAFKEQAEGIRKRG